MEEYADNELAEGVEAKRTLSQWEIDSLLGAMGEQAGPETPTEAAPKKNIRPYDFRRPDKFSKEHLRALQTVHESFARGVGSSLSSYLRTSVQVRLSSIEQSVYEEYIQQLATPTVVSIVSAEPLPGPMVIEIDMSLAFSFMDRLLGGSGQIPPKAREVTDIEMLLLKTIIKGVLVSLREHWLQLSPVTIDLDDLSFNPQTVQAALPGDVGVLILFEVRFMDISNTISMFVPYAMLEPIIDKLSAQMWFTGVHREVFADQDEIKKQLEKVPVPLVVALGATTVSVRELLGLQEGNVIKLDTSANQEIGIVVEGKTKFLGRPGRVGRNLGILITRVVQDDVPTKASARDVLLVGA